MILTRTVDPTAEPVTVQEIKTSQRISHYVDDDFISALITQAREYIGDTWGRIFLTETWTAVFDACEMPDFEMELPRWPLSSVTSIAYTDTNGDSQTWSSSLYTVDTTRYPGIVYPNYLQLWPVVRSYPAAMTVTFVAGYAAVANIPAKMIRAIHYYVSHFYENRANPDPAELAKLQSTLRGLLGLPLRNRSDHDD